MKYYKKLIGEKVYLSPMNIEDVEQYVEWYCDFKTSDGLGNSARVETVESEKLWMEEKLKNGDPCFSIIRIDDDKVIGNCKFYDINNKNRTASIGIFIGGEENRGKGYGADALNLMLDYGFNYLNYNNIMLNVKSFNSRAIACYKKVGFKEIGNRRKSYYLNGKYYDDIFMDILSEEFNKNYIKNKNIWE